MPQPSGWGGVLFCCQSLLWRKKGECREGESLPARGFGGCPPDFPMTPLGWEGGNKNAHVAPTTPTLPNARSARQRRAAPACLSVYSPLEGRRRACPRDPPRHPEQGAEELAEAGVQGAEPPDRGPGGCPPRFRKPGREPSFRGRTCDVAEVWLIGRNRSQREAYVQAIIVPPQGLPGVPAPL
jgi:hypothetical protein